MPAWYDEEPLVLPGEDFYLRAFWDLSTERQIGMGLGPIPFFARQRYALEAGLEPDMIRPFIDIIGKLDVAYLNWSAQEQKRKSEVEKPTRGDK